jgi:hypothetical protein
MLLNLLLNALPSHVVEFVKARTPRSVNDAAVTADLCSSKRRSSLSCKKPEAQKRIVFSNRQVSATEAGKRDANYDVHVGDRSQLNLQSSNGKFTAARSKQQA